MALDSPETFEEADGAVLTSEERKNLKDSDFAVPGKRKYPIHNEGHARDALSRVTQYGSPAEKKEVREAVKKKYPKMDVAKVIAGVYAEVFKAFKTMKFSPIKWSE